MSTLEPARPTRWASYKIFGDALNAQLAGRLEELEAARAEEGIEVAALRVYDSDASAGSAFDAKAARLADIASWERLLETEETEDDPAPEYEVCDGEGIPLLREQPEPGDFVRTNMYVEDRPDHYLWLRVESVEREPRRLRFVLRPSHDPTAAPPAEAITAHFIERAATWTFELERDGSLLAARVRRKSERPNVGGESGGRLAATLHHLLWKKLHPEDWRPFVEALVEG